MKKILALCALTIFGVGIYTSPSTADEIKEIQIEKTRHALWENKCKSCHGNGKKATTKGLEHMAPANLFKATGRKPLDDIIGIIENGRKEMPSFRNELSQEEIEIIARYIKIGYMLEAIQGWELEGVTQQEDGSYDL